MPSEYIVAADYAAWGLPAATTQADVFGASSIVDGYLNRPAGCVYAGTAMLNTGTPIQELREYNRSRDYLQLSYSPVASVALVEQRECGQWVKVSPKPGASYDAMPDGRLWLDNLQVMRCSDFRVTYVGGWTYYSLPSGIQASTAEIVLMWIVDALPGIPVLPGNIKKITAGDTAIEKFVDSALSDDTRAMLNPFRRVFA